MLRAIIFILVIVAALLRGGSLRHFAALPLRWLPLALGSFAVQLVIFSPLNSRLGLNALTPYLYVLSMGMLVIWVALNRHIYGMTLMALGLLLNTLAIVANGGYMPLAPEAARYAGRTQQAVTSGSRIDNNSLATTENVRLWVLTDIFPVPAGIPFATVYSIGDILLTVGVSLLCYRTIRQGVPASAPAGETGPPFVVSRQ